MTFLEAAKAILEEANEPLHYEAITERAIARGLLATSGATPDVTMASRLYMETKLEDSEFVRAGKGIFALAERRPGGIDAQVRQINEATKTRLHDLVSAMPPKRFEGLIRELLIQMGFDEAKVEVTPYSGDGGIDVRGMYQAAGLAWVNAAVQVKRWKGNVQAQHVTQLRGSLEVHQQGIIITTSGYSVGARKEAEASGKTRIALIDGGQLIDLLVRHHVGVADRALTVSLVDEEWWGELVESPNLRENGPTTSPPLPATSEPSPKTSPSAVSAKPKTLILLGQHFAISSWKEALMRVAAVMAGTHESSFMDIATTIRGSTREYFAQSPDGMTHPELIPGTPFWMETNFSAANIRRLCGQIVIAFGHKPSEVHVE